MVNQLDAEPVAKSALSTTDRSRPSDAMVDGKKEERKRLEEEIKDIWRQSMTGYDIFTLLIFCTSSLRFFSHSNALLGGLV